jgi:hypothetical protein
MQSHKTLPSISTEEKTIEPCALKDIYKNIVEVEEKIRNIEIEIEVLKYELESFKESKVHKIFRHHSATEQNIATSAGTFSGTLIGLNTLIFSGSIVMSALSTAGVGTLCFAAIMAKSYVDKNWRSPYKIEYKDIPFENILSEITSGKLDVLESSPEKGIFNAIFYPDIFSNATCEISIIVSKEKIPENARRIQKINKEIIILSKYLKQCEKQLADKQVIKEKMIQITLSNNRNSVFNKKGKNIENALTASPCKIAENITTHDTDLSQEINPRKNVFS